ncbi:MAG TPA: glycosyltransferase family 1 protein [Acidisphaera sp.]|nr:glycosyltransferase family 1 protein [Acidisphaera sp.]
MDIDIPPAEFVPDLVLDMTSLSRWTGPPVGIARVEHALAQAARRRCVFDGTAFRTLAPAWEAAIAGWHGTIADPPPDRPQLNRQPLVMALERLRLTARSPAVARLADLAQRTILWPKPHHFPLAGPDGARIAVVPRDLALGPPLKLGPQTTILSAGADWQQEDGGTIATLKRRFGFRYAVLCYDLIPTTHPQFYLPKDVVHFRAHWRRTFAMADAVLFTAEAIAADARRFCAANGIPLPPSAIVPLGFDPPPRGPVPPLPKPLQHGRYALFVSTIEPRKGHAMLLRVWRRLLQAGLPQQHDFHLVFVGRPGWMVDDLLPDIRATDRVVHLRPTGPVLHALYAGAAFCLYPSAYEGYGLPLVESFSHGRAIIASTGGAIPEVAANLAPCLDAADEAAWENAIAGWMAEPARRTPWEAAIAHGFHHPDWPTAAAAILAAAAALTRPDSAAEPAIHAVGF